MAVVDIMVRDRRRDTEGITSRQYLDALIVANRIRQFYRESEKRWVIVGVDPIRGMGGIYVGPERRSTLTECTK